MKIASIVSAVISSLMPMAFAEAAEKPGEGIPAVDYHYGMQLDIEKVLHRTDTFPKGSYAECEIEGVKVRIAGIAKGSGMIAPDMATMLAFIGHMVAWQAVVSPGYFAGRRCHPNE